MPTIVSSKAVCGLKNWQSECKYCWESCEYRGRILYTDKIALYIQGTKIIERSTNEGSQDQGGAGYSGDGRGAV